MSCPSFINQVTHAKCSWLRSQDHDCTYLEQKKQLHLLQDGDGPETITIEDTSGQYGLVVYDYEYGRRHDDIMTMKDAKAHITIYPGSEAPSTTITIGQPTGKYWLVGCFNNDVGLSGFMQKNQYTDSLDVSFSLDWCGF